MFKYYLCASLFLVGLSFSIPVKDELMFEGPDDTATVESTVREARAAPKHIGDLLKPVGDDEEERGESKKAYSFDSFNDDEKKQPKKKVEGEFNYYGEGGEGGDSGTHYSGEGGESSEEEGEGGESSEGGEGEGESEGGEYGEAEESEEEEY